MGYQLYTSQHSRMGYQLYTRQHSRNLLPIARTISLLKNGLKTLTVTFYKCSLLASALSSNSYK